MVLLSVEHRHASDAPRRGACVLPASLTAGPWLFAAHCRQPVCRGAAENNSVKEYIRRAINYDHMDLQYTFWQMFYLCFAPSRVYKTTKLHKQTKNQWARDDPAFVVVLACMVAIASLAYAVAFQVSSVWQYVRIVISAILFDFLLVGMVVATASWWFANARLRVPPTVHNVEQRVEWLNAFDVHCNSYFPLFLVVYVTQFFLVPVLLKPIFLSTLLANTLYGVLPVLLLVMLASCIQHCPRNSRCTPAACFLPLYTGLAAISSRDFCVEPACLQVEPAATTGTSRFWVTRSSLFSARRRSSCIHALL